MTYEILRDRSDTILIVGDRVDRLRAMKKVLGETLSSIRVLTCQHSEEAQPLLLDAGVSLVLLDMQMPNIDGLELCRRIKTDPKTAFVSVILITSHDSDPKMNLKGLALGADDLIARPVDNAELCARVKVALRVQRAEEILRHADGQSEADTAQFSRILESSLNEIFIFDVETLRFLNVSRGGRKNIGYSMGELREMTPLDIKPGMSTDAFMERIQPLKDGVKEGLRFETVHRRKDGTEYPVEVHLQLMADGHPVFVAMVIDITKRKQADEALRISEELFNLLMENANDGINIVTSNSISGNRVLVACNEKYVEMSGYTKAELMESLDLNQLSTPLANNSKSYLSTCLSNGTSHGGVSSWNRPDGKVNTYEWTAVPVKRNGNQYLIGIDRDITDRKQAEEDRARSHAFLQTVIDGLPEKLMVVNRDYTIALANRSALGTGRDPISACLTCHQISHSSELPCDESECSCPLKAVVVSRKTVTLEHTHIDQSGSKQFVEVVATPIFDEQGEVVQIIETSRDITERKSLEEQFRQAQKMQAIGQLVGGVAHDFNNLLQIINGYADIATTQLPSEHVAVGSIKEITKAGDHAKGLVRQLLAFSRQQIIDPEELDLNEEIGKSQTMLGRLIGEHIEFEFIAGEKVKTVFADKGNVHQVLMNLCVNARDAMPEGGKLTLKTEDVVMGVEELKTHAWAQQGGYVLLRIEDTGCGMDLEVCRQIFDPFFTTKEVGKGTGLGLSTVYGIVKQSDGHIDVVSAPGKGTTFLIYLPIALPSLGERINSISGDGVPNDRGIEMIFVVEDDPMILELATYTLENAGYTVLTAKDGEEAVQVFDKHAEEIDCVIMDVVMPRMGGKKAMGKILKKRPALRHLFVSGYSPDTGHTGFIKEGKEHLLSKPYESGDLLRKLRAVLDEDEEIREIV